MQMRRTIIVNLSLLLGACSTVQPDAGLNDVVSLVLNRGEMAPHRHPLENSTPILSSTLTADKVVEIAFLSNPLLQYKLLDLNISEAERVQAGKLRNPGISYTKLTPVSEEYNIERQILFDVIGLLTMPLKVQKETHRLEQTKLQIAIDWLRHANQCRQAYYNAVAANEHLYYLNEIATLVQLNTDLSSKMYAAGNWSKQEKVQALVMLNEIQTKVDLARLQLKKTKEVLIRLMGVNVCPEDIILPNQLPPIPQNFSSYNDIENMALQCRLDIQAQRSLLKETAKSLGLTKTTRFISVIDLGYVKNTGDNLPHQTGYNLIFDIPLFDWGEAKLAKSEAIYMQSAWLLRTKILNAQSQVREAYETYKTQYEIAHRYHAHILPLQKQLFEEASLRYNGMLISPFDLFKQKQDQIESLSQYTLNLRDFWIAEANLQFTMTGADHGL